MENIFITGISRGAGRAYAEKFLKAGWHVIGTSTTGHVPLAHKNLKVYQLDLGNHQELTVLANTLHSEGTKINVLVNNAGVNLSSAKEFPTKKISVDILRKTLEVNLVGQIDCTEQLLPLVNAKAQIVNISSGAGAFHPFIAAGTPSYQISKAALDMYTKTLASRLQKISISVWAFDPGWMQTDMGGNQAPKLPSVVADEFHTLIVSKPPTGTFWTANGERDW